MGHELAIIPCKSEEAVQFCCICWCRPITHCACLAWIRGHSLFGNHMAQVLDSGLGERAL
uniref:Uncharacterized protein n=1 Tax=Triticum urartu TaxID=4572 RepID=A0A8R7JZH2_TRIUA